MRPEIGARIVRVAELDLEALERGLVGIGERARDVDLGLRVVEGDDRGGVLGDQFGVARDVALRLLELRLGAGDHRLDALDLRLDRAAVEDEQHVALLDPRAVGELHVDDFAVDPRLDRDAGHRRDGAERLKADRNRLLGRLGDRDRDAPRWLAAAPARTARCEGEPVQANTAERPQRQAAPATPTNHVRLFISCFRPALADRVRTPSVSPGVAARFPPSRDLRRNV